MQIIHEYHPEIVNLPKPTRWQKVMRYFKRLWYALLNKDLPSNIFVTTLWNQAQWTNPDNLHIVDDKINPDWIDELKRYGT